MCIVLTEKTAGQKHDYSKSDSEYITRLRPWPKDEKKQDREYDSAQLGTPESKTEDDEKINAKEDKH
jgi:hypothetical protein